MEQNEDIIYAVSHSTIYTLCFFLAALVILLFFLYKYLNKETNGKYTVQQIVFREGGLRDRARGATVALGNRLGVQLWPQNDTDQDEQNEEDEEEGQVNSNGDSDSSDEDEPVKVNTQKSDSAAGLHNEKENSEHNSVDSSDEEEQALLKLEPEAEAEAEAGKTEEPAADEEQEDKGETSGPIVINLNQFSGSVHWSEEDGDKDVSDVTAL